MCVKHENIHEYETIGERCQKQVYTFLVSHICNYSSVKAVQLGPKQRFLK